MYKFLVLKIISMNVILFVHFNMCYNIIFKSINNKGERYMNQNCIGESIYAIRNKQRITQLEVCKGLCSCKDLSKFERGERKPDIFLLDALLQRMRTSIDKIEIFISESECSLLELRRSIEEDIIFKRYEECLNKLKMFELYKESSMPLHTQFILKIKSLIEQFKNENTMNAIQYAEEALKITLPDYSEEFFGNTRVDLEELLLLLMMCYYRELLGEKKGILQLRKLKHYVEGQYTDLEEKVKIYPQILYLLVEYLEEKKEYPESILYCKEGISLQVENGMGHLLQEFMELYTSGLKGIGDKEGHKIAKKQLYYLKEILCEYSNTKKETLARLFICKHMGKVYSLQKAIKRSRKRLKVSQEELSDGICSPETLSRIENGKQTPHSVNYQALMEKLNWRHALSSPLLEIDDFEVLERKREIERLSTLRMYKEVKERLFVLEKQIDTNLVKNKQYLLSMNTICGIELNEVKLEIALERMIEALNYTLIDFDIQDIKNGYFTDMEIHILVAISVVYYRLAHRREAVEILEALLDNFKLNTSVICNYFTSSIPIRINLSKYLEEMDELQKSIEICGEGIKLSLENNNIRIIDEFLVNKAYALERIDERDGKNRYLKACQNHYHQAFYLSNIMNHNTVSEVIKWHYQKTYRQEII